VANRDRAAVFSWVTLVFLFGAADRAYVLFGMSYVTRGLIT
jgi:hypothetical protein